VVIVDAYLATAEAATRLLRTPGLAHHWTAPSALPEFRISGLAGHLGMAVFRVAESLSADVPDLAPVDAVAYFAAAGAPGWSPESARQRHIRSLGEVAAGEGPRDLADRVRETLADLSVTLPGVAADRLVFANRAVLRLDQWLVTRMVELAVHMDDLAVSLDVETPELPADAADLVLTTLVRVASAHHGAVAVLRALSRRERAAVTVSAF
jgi:hypothetical protein